MNKVQLKQLKKVRDDVRRLTAENAVLSGEVVTTDVDVSDVSQLRADRLYVGRALDGQKDYSVYGDSKKEQEEGRRYEESMREDGESCTPWSDEVVDAEGGER